MIQKLKQSKWKHIFREAQTEYSGSAPSSVGHQVQSPYGRSKFAITITKFYPASELLFDRRGLLRKLSLMVEPKAFSLLRYLDVKGELKWKMPLCYLYLPLLIFETRFLAANGCTKALGKLLDAVAVHNILPRRFKDALLLEMLATARLETELFRKAKQISHSGLSRALKPRTVRLVLRIGDLDEAVNLVHSVPESNRRRLVRDPQISVAMQAYKTLVDWRELENNKGLTWHVPECVVRQAVRDYQPRLDSRPGVIANITSSLGPGGAERQFVNTVNALSDFAARQETEPNLTLLAIIRVARRTDDTGFFLQHINKGSKTRVVCCNSYPQLNRMMALDGRPEVTRLLELLPESQRKIVAAYYNVFAFERPEVVHLWQDDTNILGGLAAVMSGVPRIILNARSMRPVKFSRYRRYLKYCYNRLLELDNVTILFNCEAAAKDYAKWLDLPNNSFPIAHNTIDVNRLKYGTNEAALLAAREKLGLTRESFVVGGCMRMSNEKRPQLWLDVAVSLAEQYPNMQFVCIGDGPLYEQMCAQAKTSRHSRRIHLPGNISRIEPWIGIMDVLLNTSKIEGLPNIIIEAQALGVPVVATNVGGTREILIDGKTGFLSQSSVPKLAKLCADIYLDSGWRQEAGPLASQYAHSKFSTEKLVANLMRAYDYA